MSRQDSRSPTSSRPGSPTEYRSRVLSPSTVTKEIRSPRMVEDSSRPPVIAGLLNARRQKDEPAPKVFQEFEKMVEENDIQLARYEFLDMNVFYDGALVGPTEIAPPKKGGSGIEIIFKYYCSRRQQDAMNGPVVQTFSEAEQHNKTMDRPELSKFCKDFFPSVFSQRDINWLFAQANKFAGVSNENTFTMDINEFACLLCQMGCQLCKGGTVEEIVRHMGKALGLYNPRELVRKLDLQGRTDAGFGAWKAEKPTIVQPVDSSKRCVLGIDAIKHVLSVKEMSHMKLLMETSFPTMNLVEWLPFEGHFVSIALPRGGVRKGKNTRFRIVLGNTAPRAFIVLSRVESLPFLSLTYPPPRPIAPGMELTLDIQLEALPMGEHLGAIVFSVEEGGPELFKCPVYIRVSKENGHTLADSTANTIAKFVPREKFEDECRKLDFDSKGALSGKIPSVALSKVFEALKLQLSPERLISLISVKVEQDADGAVEYADFADLLYKDYEALSDLQKDRLGLGSVSIKLEPLERALAIGKVAIPLNPSLAGLVDIAVSLSRGGTPAGLRTGHAGSSPSGRGTPGGRGLNSSITSSPSHER